jgi:hypothetical protein
VVGRKAALPRPGIHPDPPCAGSADDEGRNHLHVRHGRADSALAQAREAAGDANVAIAGGAATVNQYLAAGLIDELPLHVAPVLLGVGERLFDGIGNVYLEALGVKHIPLVTHMSYRVPRNAAHDARTSRGQPTCQRIWALTGRSARRANLRARPGPG